MRSSRAEGSELALWCSCRIAIEREEQFSRGAKLSTARDGSSSRPARDDVNVDSGVPIDEQRISAVSEIGNYNFKSSAIHG